jgi:hypothetical protein
MKPQTIYITIPDEDTLKADLERKSEIFEAMRAKMADSLDTCENCEATSICTPITLQDNDLFADLLVCDSCKLSLTLSHMGDLSRERVAQLRGKNNEQGTTS